MKKWIKNIITVFVVLFCCFIMFLGVGYYLMEADMVEYDVNKMTIAELKAASVTIIGDTYQGQTQRGRVYYELAVTFGNPGNITKKESEFWFSFYDEETERYADVDMVWDVDKFGWAYDNVRVLPAGKEGIIRKVISVGQDVEQFTLIYKGIDSDKEQKIKVNL